MGLNLAYDDATPLPAVASPSCPRVIVAADADEVMRVMLEDMISHVAGVICGCPTCDRYLQVRALLLEPFADRVKGAGC